MENRYDLSDLYFTGMIIINVCYHGENKDPYKSDFRDYAATDKSRSSETRILTVLWKACQRFII